jgi:hypothetical protein
METPDARSQKIDIILDKPIRAPISFCSTRNYKDQATGSVRTRQFIISHREMKRTSKSKTLACNACNQVFNKPEHLRVSFEQRGNICLLRSVTISHVGRSL